MSFQKVSISGPAIDRLESTGKKENTELKGSVTHVQGEERLFGTFRYTVRYDCNPVNPPDFGDVINKRVRLRFNQLMNDESGTQYEGHRTLYGIVTKARQHGKGVTPDSTLGTTSYLLVIRSSLWQLHLSRGSATYMNRPVVSRTEAGGKEGVLNQVIAGDHGLTLDTSTLKKTYSSQQTIRHRDDETDLEFVDRLAQTHGIVYYVPSSTEVSTSGTSKTEDHSGEVKLLDEDTAYERYWRCRLKDGKPTKTLKAVPEGKNRARKEGTLNSYSYEHNMTPSQSAAVGVDFDTGRVQQEWTDGEAGDAPDTEGTVWEPSRITGYTDQTPKEAWGQHENQGSPMVGETQNNQLRAGRRVLRGHTHSRLLGAGMRFALHKKTCEDVLTHFNSGSGDASQEFVVRRMLVSTLQPADESVKMTLQTEFEAFPASKDTTYQGDRYVKRGTGSESTEDSGTHERSRFNDLAAKYSSLRDSVKALVVAVMQGKKSLREKQIRDLKNIPGGAEGEETIDPYELSLEATVAPSSSSGPSPSPPAGPEIRTAVVQEVPGGETDKAKQGKVRVSIDHDGKSEVTEEAWAHVLSFWAGNDWGAQFMPRVGTRVLVVNTAQGEDHFYVIGSLYQGNAPMPHPKDPTSKSAIRSHSHRDSPSQGNKDVYNEIMMKDEENKEEIRFMAPTYRTDIAGLGKDIVSEKKKYREFTGDDLFEKRTELSPIAQQVISNSEWKTLSSAKKGDDIAVRDPFVSEISKEYEMDVNEDKRIGKKKYKNIENNTFLKLNPNINVPKEKSNKIKLSDFQSKKMEESKRKESIKRSEKVSWGKVNVLPTDDGIPPEKVSYEWLEKNVKNKKVKFRYSAAGALTRSTADTGVNYGRGVGMLKYWIGRLGSHEVHGGSYSIYDIHIIEWGKDLFDFEDIKKVRDAYTKINVGKDMYNVFPYEELYGNEKEENPLKEKKATREEYTQNVKSKNGNGEGVLRACKGNYKIHTYGDRLEIFRSDSSKSEDVFGQEMNMEAGFKGKSLPDFYKNQFREKNSNNKEANPILVLNKNGTICIQSNEGINIESGSNIQIQAKNNIKMKSGGIIKEESKNKHLIQSKDVDINGSMDDGKIKLVSHEIEIGDRSETKEVKIKSRKIEKSSNHHYEETPHLTIKKEQNVESLAYVHSVTSVMHNIQSSVGTKLSAVDSKSGIVDNKNVVVDSANKASESIVSALRTTGSAIKSVTHAMTEFGKAMVMSMTGFKFFQ